MFYLDLLQGKQSKSKVLNAVAHIADSKPKFKKFIEEFKKSDGRDAQKLAWVVGTIADSQPQLIAAHVSTLLKKLKSPCHAAVKRNVLRAVDKIQLQNRDLGLAADVAFTLLDDPSEPIAVRVFSMSILLKVCLLEPELAPELIAMLTLYIPHASAGFRARANKIIKILDA